MKRGKRESNGSRVILENYHRRHHHIIISLLGGTYMRILIREMTKPQLSESLFGVFLVNFAFFFTITN